MAGLVKLNLERSVVALVNRDSSLCKSVIADDTDVDEAERTV
ncbi:MAG: PhoU domain-containing protein, partial [Verrucomicrobiales bacterium]